PHFSHFPSLPSSSTHVPTPDDKGTGPRGCSRIPWMDGPNLSARAEPIAPLPSYGELILANGVRRPLTAPFSLVGGEVCCEVRDNDPGSIPLHWTLVHVPCGFMLRDFQTEAGTFVNGERVTLCPLREGDVVPAGPFQFEVHLPLAVTAADEPPLPE